MSLVVAIAGGLAGAVALSLLAALGSALLDPETFGEQQFVVGFAFTAVLGMMLGSATSLAWGSAFSGDGGPAEFASMLVSPWIAPAWLGGAALVAWGSRRLISRQ